MGRFNYQDAAQHRAVMLQVIGEYVAREASLGLTLQELAGVAWRLDGIDIAHPYQWATGDIDWNLVPLYDLIVVKSTQGTGYLNPKFVETMGVLRARHTRYRGPYHFLTWWEDGVRQAEWFLRSLDLIGGLLSDGEFIQLDVEAAPLNGVWNYPSVAIVEAFWNRVEQAGLAGRQTLYLGGSTPISGDAWCRAQARWLPNYTDATSPAGTVIRQWGGGARGAFVPGINGGKTRVDSNQIEDRATLDRIAYPSVIFPPIPPSNVGDDMPRWLVKADLDGPQPVDLADGLTRIPLTRLAPGREEDAIRTAWLRDGGPQGRMQPPAWAKIEQFGVHDPANPNVPIIVTIWRIDPAMMDADAGPLPAGAAVDEVLTELTKLAAEVDANTAAIAGLDATVKAIPPPPTHGTIELS